MAEAFGLAVGVIGVTIPAIKVSQALIDDLKRIRDAPETLSTLKSDVDSFRECLLHIKAIEESEWRLLGDVIVNQMQATIESCEKSCSKFLSELKGWMKHSGDIRQHSQELVLKDRLKIGFKQHQIKAISEQLQDSKLTFSLTIQITNL